MRTITNAELEAVSGGYTGAQVLHMVKDWITDLLSGNNSGSSSNALTTSSNGSVTTSKTSEGTTTTVVAPGVISIVTVTEVKAAVGATGGFWSVTGEYVCNQVVNTTIINGKATTSAYRSCGEGRNRSAIMEP